MTARTTAQRQAALRERRKKAGLMEVRGIWAPQWLHEWLKEDALATIARDTETVKANKRKGRNL